MTTQIDNSQDIIDSRDIIARLEELTGEVESLEEAREELKDAQEQLDEAQDEENGCTLEEIDEARAAVEEARENVEDWAEQVQNNKDEREVLQALADEGEGYADWEYGETLIRRSYWVEYAQETAEDCGMVNESASWPNNCIDWERAARELEVDYATIDYDGVEYLIRS